MFLVNMTVIYKSHRTTNHTEAASYSAILDDFYCTDRLMSRREYKLQRTFDVSETVVAQSYS